MGLSSFSLYAKEDSIYLDRSSIDRAECTETDCYFPGKVLSDKNIFVNDQINWDKGKNLILHTKRDIVFEKGAKILGRGDVSIILKSGMKPEEKSKYVNTVVFKGDHTQVDMLDEGQVKIYYNPVPNQNEHKYLNPKYNFYRSHVKAGNDNDHLKLYMLVNDVYELQSIGVFLSGDYALSQDINAAETKFWNDKRGFEPLKDASKKMSFSGDFDGNGYSIKNLFINWDEHDVGLFGMCGGSDITHNKIENLTLENIDITGDHYVGGIAGFAANSDFFNIKIINPVIKSKNVSGCLAGTTDKVVGEAIQIAGDVKVVASEGKDNALVVGGASKSIVTLIFETEQKRNDILKTYRLLGNGDDKTQICLKSGDVQPTICLYNNPTEDQKFDDKIGVNPEDLTKIWLIRNIETLTPLEVMRHVLKASLAFDRCIKKNNDKNGGK